MLKVFTEIEWKEQRRIKFFLPSFLFRFPKKKKKKGKQSSGVITPVERGGGARNWRTASSPSIPRKILVLSGAWTRIIQYTNINGRGIKEGDQEGAGTTFARLEPKNWCQKFPSIENFALSIIRSKRSKKRRFLENFGKKFLHRYSTF